MTSKEALEIIGNIDIDGRYPYPNHLKDRFPKEFKVLQSLGERDTPKKPINDTNHVIRQHNCSVCKRRVDIPQLIEVNFCPKCGQRLDWSE